MPLPGFTSKLSFLKPLNKRHDPRAVGRFDVDADVDAGERHLRLVRHQNLERLIRTHRARELAVGASQRNARGANLSFSGTIVAIAQIADERRSLARRVLGDGMRHVAVEGERAPSAGRRLASTGLPTAAMLWLTSSTVRPSDATSRILPRHFR